MKKTALSLCIAMLILTSCTVLQQKKEQIKIPGVHEGTKGAVLEFLPNSPQKELYEDRVFDILVSVHNQGAADIRAGMLYIGAGQQIQIEGEEDKRFDLAGKTTYNPEGSKTIEEFRARTSLLLPTLQSQDTTITATACYPYQTEATAIVCIDTDIAGMVKNKPCRTRKQMLSAGQGAPLTITYVETKIMSHENPERVQPEFHIKLRNAGPGQAITQEKIYDACTGKSVGTESWNRADITARLSDKQLTCRPKKAKISPDTTIICTLEEGIPKTKGTYTAPLSVEAKYGYIERIIKSITIRKLVTK